MASDADAAKRRKKKLRRVKFKLGLTGTGPPMLPRPPVEVSTKFADEGGVLELVPEGKLYTEHVGDSGEMERFAGRLADALLLSRSYRGAGGTILEQVADKYRSSSIFSGSSASPRRRRAPSGWRRASPWRFFTTCQEEVRCGFWS